MTMVPNYPKERLQDVLISIKPEYVEKILVGEKRYEFRKAIFKSKQIGKIFVYASSPVQRIVASFELEDVLDGNPKEIWGKCKHAAGISKEKFFEYFEGRDNAFSLKIKNLQKFDSPIRPVDLIPEFRPPQSYMYVNKKLENVLTGSI